MKFKRIYDVHIPVIGVTGGIGSGKTTFCKYLEGKGLNVIYADQLIKEIYSRPESKAFIEKEFPTAIKNNSISFPIIKEMIFKNLNEKKKLETFLYQYLPEHFKSKIRTIDQVLFYEVPLLFENKLEKELDCTVLISSDVKNQISRTISRDHLEEKFVKTMIDNQMPLTEKKNHADFIIENDGTIDELFVKIEQLLIDVLKKIPDYLKTP